ncbi:MAG: HDOD domain-containing protein [Methylococcales bacterium]
MLSPSSPSLQITDLFKGDLQLTSPPNIYFELQHVIEDPNKSFIDVGAIIENDPSLTMRLLKIVNSAFYNFPAQIGSITRAISIIGNRELQNLVLATVIIDRFSSQPGGLMTMKEFWARSVLCALLSRELSRFNKISKDMDAIFVCGLLHDIGQLVFFRRIPVLTREVGLFVEANNVDEIFAEQNIIGFNHYDTGAELARHWNLPKMIIESIGQHANSEYAGEFADVANMVRMANKISKLDADKEQPADICTDIPADELAKIMAKTHDQFEQIFRLFYPN